jgi:hypothetical protein
MTQFISFSFVIYQIIMVFSIVIIQISYIRIIDCTRQLFLHMVFRIEIAQRLQIACYSAIK